MAADVQMTDVEPITVDSDLPPPSIVEQWTSEQLLGFAPIQEILWKGKNRATVSDAEIDGEAFLECGDDRHFWMGECHLPLGPSVKLEGLVRRIKNMGKEESRVESPPKPTTDTKTAERLGFLHGLLWGQEKPLLAEVFPDFQHPSWNLDTNPHLNSNETRNAVKLTLSHITRDPYRLPCGAKELLVRKVYREMYGILVKAQKDRMKYLDKNELIPDGDKIILILGQPGIGKTWFLTYVLVRRLLEGKPTIFQVGENFRGDMGYATGTDYLIDSNGVRAMAPRPPFIELDNPDIWVLADRTPFGRPREFAEHNWLVVVTSSPREANHHHIVKECSPQTFYFPAWDWNEVVAAAALKGLSEKMWDTLFTLFDRYGPIPRLLFETLLPPGRYGTGMVEDGTAVVGDATEEVGDATGEDGSPLKRRITAYELVLNQEILELLGLEPDIALSANQYGVNSCDAIILIRPRKMKRYKYVSDLPVFDIATSYICQKIASAAVGMRLKAARKMYEFLLGQGETKTSAGWIFEGRMHILFQRRGPFKATKLGGLKTIAIDMSHKPCKDFSNLSELGSMLRKGPGSQSIDPANIGVYFKPVHCNFCAVDSFAITTDAKTNKPVPVLFQMTVSTSHPVKAHGLASIWGEIPAELKKIPAILVFVVPVGAANKFSKQTIVPSTSNFDKWEQYVLPVSAETLWENTAPDCDVSAS